MDQHQINFLRSVDLFAASPPQTMADISTHFHVRTYANGEILFLEGSRSSTFYIVAAGRVQLYKVSLDGQEQTLFVMRPRDFFDVLPLIDNQPHPISAAAMTDVRLYVISEQTMVEVMQRHPAIASTLLPYMSRMLRQLATLAGDLAFTDVSTRLARLILLHAREEGQPTPHGIYLSWGLTHRQIARLIGTAREVVTRSLRHFEQEGIIQGKRGRLLIKDWEKLREHTLTDLDS